MPRPLSSIARVMLRAVATITLLALALWLLLALIAAVSMPHVGGGSNF